MSCLPSEQEVRHPRCLSMRTKRTLTVSSCTLPLTNHPALGQGRKELSSGRAAQPMMSQTTCFWPVFPPSPWSSETQHVCLSPGSLSQLLPPTPAKSSHLAHLLLPPLFRPALQRLHRHRSHRPRDLLSTHLHHPPASLYRGTRPRLQRPRTLRRPRARRLQDRPLPGHVPDYLGAPGRSLPRC